MQCPGFIVALLRDIDRYYSICYWNKNQKEYSSPLENTGSKYVNPVFEMHAYSWDDDKEQPYNFKCGNIEISWYKHVGRNPTINFAVMPEEAVEMYNRCIDSIREDFGKYAPDSGIK